MVIGGALTQVVAQLLEPSPQLVRQRSEQAPVHRRTEDKALQIGASLVAGALDQCWLTPALKLGGQAEAHG